MKNYNPRSFEEKIYQLWEEKKQFNPDQSSESETFSIVIPPPNVTGYLHIGHALVNSLQDILVRRKRMQGYKTLWLPGTDHAGISTQIVVEKDLLKKGIKRKELGKEKFVQLVWEWKEKHGNQIYKQLKRLGASLDWSREKFTLDESLSQAVRKSFVSLYNEGLIYRAEYLVHWCPKDRTALSDLEVDFLEIKGELTQIRYPLVAEKGFIEIATTRPETLLGDTAIVVHPEDKRYKNLIGKKALVPLVKREICIIADESCDPEFGTGAVKITPAHDPNDFLLGKKYSLEFINIFDETAKINSVYPDLKGVDRFEARKKIIEILKKEGLWVSSKTHIHSVGHSQRSKTVIEPRISTQWFCKMDAMAQAALKEVDKKKVQFFPVSQEKIFREWLGNIQDWCLSRQLWWGHPIPAWHCNECGEISVSEKEIKKCQKCDSSKITPDPDVLDTWFSSGLFPFSTMGWPNEKVVDFKNFYPNSVLVTGYDILFFWVARMIMLGIKLTKQVPFPEVFLHGLVRDEKGEKMSKTKGNVIDPLEIIEKHGADALRFSLCKLTIGVKDLKLPEQEIIQSKYFINKLWNATKFVLFHLEKNQITDGDPLLLKKPEKLDMASGWIIEELKQLVVNYNDQLDQYRFFEVAKLLYNFIWGNFCDWYIESTKPMLFDKLGEEKKQSALFTLCFVLEQSLKLLHPICPFVSEKLWRELPTTAGFLMTQKFPIGETPITQYILSDTNEHARFFEGLEVLINTIRTVQGENHLKQKTDFFLFIKSDSEDFIIKNLENKIKEYEPMFLHLSNLNHIEFKKLEEFEDAEKEGYAIFQGREYAFTLKLLSKNITGEKKRLESQLANFNKRKEHLETKLKNPSFVAKAPYYLVQNNEKEVSDLKTRIQKTEQQLKEL